MTELWFEQLRRIVLYSTANLTLCCTLQLTALLQALNKQNDTVTT